MWMQLRWWILGFGLLTTAVACDGGGDNPAPTETATATAAATTAATQTPAATATQPATAVPPTPTPVARPTSTPTVRTTATTPPTTTPAGSGTLVTNGPRNSGKVALTFDMGGRVEPALDIMNWLIANRVAATIFMTGAMVDNVNTDAGRQVLALLDQHADLFDLGNHSYSHPDFREISATEAASELTRTATTIARFTDVDPKPLFRPPFGGQDATVVSRVAASGYTRTIMWDVDTIDWRPESDGGPTAADIVEKVTTRATGGSIVLMHLGGYNTYEALPTLVAGLRDRGLGFATVSDLLGIPR